MKTGSSDISHFNNEIKKDNKKTTPVDPGGKGRQEGATLFLNPEAKVLPCQIVLDFFSLYV